GQAPHCARELGETDPRSWLDGRGMLVAPLSRRSLQARRDRSQRKDSSPARIDNAANAVYLLGCSAHELFLGSPLSRPRKVELAGSRSEEHTSELQSRGHLVCRLLLEKKK